jgi:DNA-binding transcriptional regulator LsrR (DeoR family)
MSNIISNEQAIHFQEDALETNRLAVKVCRLFYEENLTKVEIERRLHISRFKVARILREAERVGLVTIQIREPQPDLSDLESEVESRFGLKSVALVWDDGQSLNLLKKKVGKVAADYVLGILREEDVLGVGWGTTTFELVNALPDRIKLNVRVVQVSGGNTAIESGIDSQALTMRLGRKFGVEPYLLHAPTFVDRPETREMLMKESAFRQIFEIYNKCTVLIAGVGAFLPGGFVGSRNISPSEMALLHRQKAAGEFLTYCFDLEGNPCRTETLNRTIAIPIEVIKKIPCSIAVAVGSQKAGAVLGTIRAGLINTLITDTTTARTLLDNLTKKKRKGGKT